MKTNFIIWALFLSVAIVNAQEEKKKATVRIRNVEKINGVEKITDTTYTADADQIDLPGNIGQIKEIKDSGGRSTKIIMLGGETDDTSQELSKDQGTRMQKIITKDASGKEKVLYVSTNGTLSPAEEKEFMENTKNLQIDCQSLHEATAKLHESLQLLEGTEKLQDSKTLIYQDEVNGKENGQKKTVRIFMIKEVKVVELSSEEQKMINSSGAITDGKLLVNEMKFFPNPNDGKFTVSFTLPQKGDASIVIMNMEGKKIYEEEVHSVSGTFEKRLDISENPKGAYFMRIKQGEHSQLKKIVLD